MVGVAFVVLVKDWVYHDCLAVNGEHRICRDVDPVFYHFVSQQFLDL